MRALALTTTAHEWAHVISIAALSLSSISLPTISRLNASGTTVKRRSQTIYDCFFIGLERDAAVAGHRDSGRSGVVPSRMRRSDVVIMAWAHITTDRKIGVLQQKTGRRLLIPLHRDLLAALDAKKSLLAELTPGFINAVPNVLPVRTQSKDSRLVEAEAMTIEDYRGLLMERRAARVEPNDVGGLGGKCGIIALAPGFPPGEADLVRPRLRRQHLEGVAGMWRFTAATST